MKQFDFPKLEPPAVDYPYLERPTVVNMYDVEGTVLFPQGGGKTKYLITEYTAGAKHHNCGVFVAQPGQGSQWHTHPKETGEEEFLYILKGKGTLYYKQVRKDYEIPLKEGDGIFTGHLTHYVKNTGTEDLWILFYLAPLPVSTIIYGVRRDKGVGYVDSVNLEPPRLVHLADPEEVRGHRGGATNKRFFTPQNTPLKYMSGFGVAIERPGTGTEWHTHPMEEEQEDLFFIAKGKGTMILLQGGKVHTFEFKEGDAILSQYLTNYTWNTGKEDLIIPVAGAPLGSKTARHKGDLLTL